jgi:hypothetical protein
MLMSLIGPNHVLEVFFTVAIICICCHVHSKVDLSSNLVLLCIEDKVALTKTSGHPTNILDTLPVLLPVFIRLNDLVLHVNKDPHLLSIRVVLVIIELHGI